MIDGYQLLKEHGLIPAQLTNAEEVEAWTSAVETVLIEAMRRQGLPVYNLDAIKLVTTPREEA